MFTYCLNNPVIFADECGTDACIVIDDEEAASFGHIGFLVEDDEGQWWHFYWGPQNGWIYIFAINVDAYTFFKEYEGEISLNSINGSGQYWGEYDRMIYLDDDFSDCIDIVNNLDGDYNLYFNNCSQVSLGILAQANTQYQDRLQRAVIWPFPDDNFDYLEDACNESTSYRGGGSGKHNMVNLLC